MKPHNGHKAGKVKKHVRERSARNLSQLRCGYCKMTFLGEHGKSSRAQTDDHIIPTSRGGNNSLENRIDCCSKCNNIKGDKLPDEFMGYLKDYLEMVKGGNIAHADRRLTTLPANRIHVMIDQLEIVARRTRLFKAKMLIASLDEPLPRAAPGERNFKPKRREQPDNPEYKIANQKAIESIAAEMPQNKPVNEKPKAMPSKFSVSAITPPKYEVGHKVFRPYENCGNYYVHETIVYKRTIYDEVLVGLESKDGPYEKQGEPTREVQYYVKGCDHAVAEDELYNSEAAAKFHLKEKYFGITVKVP